MRVFLDENVDPLLAEQLSAHVVESVRTKGWFGVSNGELLARIEADFEVLVSHDKGIEHQQNWDGRALSLLLVESPSTSLASYEAILPLIHDALDHIKPGEVIRLNAY